MRTNDLNMGKPIKTVRYKGYTWEVRPVSKEELLERKLAVKDYKNRQIRYLARCLETNETYEASYFYKSDIAIMTDFLYV